MYVLLRGKKRFRLFSPADASKLQTHGAIACVHSNGRICYENEMTHADGSTSEARQAMAASQEMDAAAVELELAEESVEQGEAGSKERLARAEERMDIAMERTMDFEMMGGSDGDEEEEEYDGEMWGNTGLAMSDGKSKKDGDGDGDVAKSPATAKDPAEFEPTPKHFSKIDLSLEDSIRFQTWPSLQSTTMTEVELQAGDVLYLPAGWFHEVLSETTEDNTGHMAFNYWFHPPDGETFEAPYASPFWFADWKKQRTEK